MFYSDTYRPKRVRQPKCSKLEPVYEERIDTKTGKPYLKKVKNENIYERIQTAAEGVTLKELIKRYNIDPSESAKHIESATGEILDYTNLPQNMLEALETSIQAKNIFELAAPEIKQKFNNNYTEFLAAASTGNLQKALKEFLPSEKPVNEVNTKTPTVETKPTQPVEQGVRYE